MKENTVYKKIELWSSDPEVIFSIAFIGLVIGVIGGSVAISHHLIWVL